MIAERMESATDYERFSYENFDESPLTLEEAVRKANILRSHDSQHVYRVVPFDDELKGFYVESASKTELYANFLSRILKAWGDLFASKSMRVR